MSRLQKLIDGDKYKKDSAIHREDELLSEFVNLALRRFNWTNLPPFLTSDRLETMLIEYGHLGGYVNEVGQLTILPIMGIDKVNIYNEHIQYRLFGFNGTDLTLDSDKICRLKNNPTATNDIDTLSIYAKRIADIESTQEVNLFQQNIPKIISSNRDTLLTAKNIIKKIQDFKFVVFNREGAKISSNTEILDNTAPFILDKLADYENFYRNKVLSFLAINNANTDKKEKLLVDEVNANNDFINTMLDMMYDCRVEFCEEVKEKFGIEISVEKRECYDGTIHDNDTTTDREQY